MAQTKLLFLVLLLTLLAPISLAKPKKSSSAANKRPVFPLTEAIPSLEAGIVSTFSSDFFNNYTPDIIDLLESQLLDFPIPDTQSSLTFASLKFKLDFTKLKLANFRIGHQGSFISIKNHTQSVDLLLTNLSFAFSLNYELSSRPEWFHDKGQAQINATDFNVSLRIFPK